MKTTRFETVESLLAYGEKHNELKVIVSIDKNIADIVSNTRLELELLHALFTDDCVLNTKSISYQKVEEDESSNLAYYQIEMDKENFIDLISELQVDEECKAEYEKEKEWLREGEAKGFVVQVVGTNNDFGHELTDVRQFLLNQEQWMSEIIEAFKTHPVLSSEEIEDNPEMYSVSWRVVEAIIDFSLRYGRFINLDHYGAPVEGLSKINFFYEELLFEASLDLEDYSSYIKLVDVNSVQDQEIADRTFNYPSIVKHFKNVSDNHLKYSDLDLKDSIQNDWFIMPNTDSFELRNIDIRGYENPLAFIPLEREDDFSTSLICNAPIMFDMLKVCYSQAMKDNNVALTEEIGRVLNEVQEGLVYWKTKEEVEEIDSYCEDEDDNDNDDDDEN